jgi:hypothetical protein
MSDCGKDIDKSSWAVGGGVLLGTGVGFFFLQKSALFFVGCILVGIGVGLILAAVISALKRRQ